MSRREKTETEKLVAKCLRQIKTLEREDDVTVTRWVPLEVHDDKEYAIVFGWMEDLNDNGEWVPSIAGKVAYCSTKSMMHEFDFDWLMPYDEETGDVDDTMVYWPSKWDCEWLVDQWFRIRNSILESEREAAA